MNFTSEENMKTNTSYFDEAIMPDTRREEIQILSDLISNPSLMPMAREYITPGLFSGKENAKAWNVITEMSEKDEPIDITTVGMRIDKTVVVEMMQPAYNFGGCTEKTVLSHCSALIRAAAKRRIFAEALGLMHEAGNMAGDYNNILHRVSELARIAQNVGCTKARLPLNEVLNDLAAELEEMQISKGNGKRTRIPTGFPYLDTLTYSGFNAGNLVVLAARPSVGKTAVMLKMARTAAQAGFPVTVYSLEMTNKELAQRLLFATGIVTPQMLASGSFDWDRLEAANGKYSSIPVFLNDTVKTADDIIADIISAHSQGQCDMAFVDYLGLIQSPDARTPLYQTIAGITSRLKQVAKECKIPIVLLCQLNRNIEAENRPPRMSDLRDSGSIEQDADIVLMLERQRDGSGNETGNLNVWVRKNRQGEGGGNTGFSITPNRSFSDFEEIRPDSI